MHVYIYIYIYIHTDIHTYMHVHTHILAYKHAYVHIYIHAQTHVHKLELVRVWVSVLKLGFPCIPHDSNYRRSLEFTVKSESHTHTSVHNMHPNGYTNYIHSYIHTYIRTYVHTYIHTKYRSLQIPWISMVYIEISLYIYISNIFQYLSVHV